MIMQYGSTGLTLFDVMHDAGGGVDVVQFVFFHLVVIQCLLERLLHQDTITCAFTRYHEISLIFGHSDRTYKIMPKYQATQAAGVHVTSVLTPQHEHAILDEGATPDEKTLGALGYKQEFKRYADVGASC